MAAVLVGCAVTWPPAPPSNPADPHAPEAATAPLRPTLLATSRSFVSPAAGDREQKAKQMDMSKMQQAPNDMGAMQHPMSGLSDLAKPAPASANSYYTCVMHPQIHEDKPGQCPICGMTLVKKLAAPEGAKP
ncbi:MAG: heavy metal-binding domain-containing protein [Chthoniobacterales bacterium]